jgi:hypothetical protein
MSSPNTNQSTGNASQSPPPDCGQSGGAEVAESAARPSDRIDLSFQPRWYRSDPVQDVRGTLRRSLLKEAGLGQMLGAGLSSALSPTLDACDKMGLFEQMGPAALSGEELPELSDGAVELCRIRFNGTVHDEVTAVYACPSGQWEADRIAELEESMGIEPGEFDDEEADDDEREGGEEEDEEDESREELRAEYWDRRWRIEEQVSGTYVVHVVDEVGLHDGDDEPFEVICVSQPFTMGGLIAYLESCDWWGMGAGLVWGAWHRYNEGRMPGDEDFVPLEQAADFVVVESDFYPELGAYYRDQLRP